MGYTEFDEIAEKCRKFKDGEPVRCTERQYDKDGVLDEGSILVVSDIFIKTDSKEKIKKNENLTDDDIEFLCCHIETGRHFFINGSQLKKADNEEALNVVSRYNRKCFREEICSNIVGGLLFIMLLLFAITVAFFLLRKVFNIDCDNMYIGSIFFGTIIGFVFVIIACVSSIYEYRFKSEERGISYDIRTKNKESS